MIENHNYSIAFIVLSGIVIILTPWAIQSDHTVSGYSAITPEIIIGDCLMVSLIFLARKGSGLPILSDEGLTT